jgi:hypothetical protein
MCFLVRQSPVRVNSATLKSKSASLSQPGSPTGLTTPTGVARNTTIQETMTQQNQRTCAAFHDVHKDPVRLDNAMLHASHSRPERFMQTSALTAGLRRKRGARENGISWGFSAPTVHPNREDRCLPVDTSECRSKPPKINEYRLAALVRLAFTRTLPTSSEVANYCASGPSRDWHLLTAQSQPSERPGFRHIIHGWVVLNHLFGL